MKPLISIIIPAYHIAGLLPGMVKDLLGQPFKFFEILIVIRADDPELREGISVHLLER